MASSVLLPAETELALIVFVPFVSFVVQFLK
jgi:hypothetical protein